MKMQMWKILIFAAVDDESIRLELEFVHKALGGGIEIGQEGGIGGIKVCKGVNLSLREEEHVKAIAWGRMMKGDQVRGLAEPVDWEEEAHVGDDPVNKPGDESEAKKFTHLVF